MIDTDALARIRAETPGIREGGPVHLLAAGSALMPRQVVDAIVDHTRLEAEIGGYEAHAARKDALEALYGKVAAHVGASPREIAIMENATVAWCHAFYALPLRPGQRILTAEAEYAANYVAFLHRARRDGIVIEVVPSDETGALDVEALERTIDADVGLVAMTWVPTNGGLVNPAAEVGRIARAHGVPYLLDACQAAGQFPIDVGSLGCDFLSATGRKFLRGPRGTGYLYVAERWLDRLEPAMLDHYGGEWTAPDRYELRGDARRFETWENAYALRMGLAAALDYAAGIGIGAIEARVRHLADHCRDLLARLPGARLRDLGTRPAGIVSAEIAGQDSVRLCEGMAAQGFAIGTSSRASTMIDAERRDLPTLLRIAPHYYNTEDEIAACVETLGALARNAA